ncbi:GNAT family N-acetyltransferase [Yoonia sp.]|uniref:GNAT family N-acetyltransferase n=1 Tax=Yoonia sp. TaxID=2212373 RepID=UPI003F6B17E3
MQNKFTIETVSTGSTKLEQKLADCEQLHLQLRPEIELPYVQHIKGILNEGARFAIGANPHGICCLALYRVFKTTLGGTRLYIDDLVTDERQRGQSYGECLLNWIEDEARSEGCKMATLESGVQRADAHRFYFRTGYAVTAFSFEKKI